MFRFTIREIVLVTLVAGVGLGWFLELRKRQRVTGVLRDSYTTLQNCESKWNELVKLIEARGGKVEVGKSIVLYMEPGGRTDNSHARLQGARTD